jgi:spore coat protein U-like protein
MNRSIVRYCGSVVVALGLMMSASANAAVSCSLSITPITVVYDPTVATENITTGTVTVSCTRAISDPSTFDYSVTASNGLQPNGTVNRVQLGVNRYNYELYRLSPYVNGNRWQTNGGTRFTGTINFGALLASSNTHSFDLRVPGSQTVVPAGTYTDTVTSTLRNLAGTTIFSTTFGVSVLTTNSCQLSTPPGNINFSYTSFQASAATASTSFKTRCTSGLPYTIALDATSGTLLGLNYSLALSSPGATGTGVAQIFSINGTIASGQAGTCAVAACSSSAARTITVTY